MIIPHMSLTPNITGGQTQSEAARLNVRCMALLALDDLLNSIEPR